MDVAMRSQNDAIGGRGLSRQHENAKTTSKCLRTSRAHRTLKPDLDLTGLTQPIPKTVTGSSLSPNTASLLCRFLNWTDHA